MGYFKSFPYVGYTFPDNVTRAFKNISLRPDLVQAIKDGTNIEFYDLEDGETPETVAYNFYKDVNLNWVIMLANDVFNLYTDWPKSDKHFQDYILEKYRVQLDSDGIERTLTDTQVKEFVQFVGTPSNSYLSDINLYDSENSPKITITPHHFVDEDDNIYAPGSYKNETDAFGRTITKPTLTPVSIEDWERSLNEEKKTIIVPSVNIVSKIKRELNEILNG